MCSNRRKIHGCRQKKPESTSSAIFCAGTAVKACELKRCADRVRIEPTTKMKSSKANFVTWTFRLPPKRQLNILLNFFFPFIDVWYFFLKFKTSTLSNNRFAALVAQKHRAISRQEKMTFFSSGRVALGLPSPSPRVCTDRRTYGCTLTSDTKFSRNDRLPNLRSNGAPLVRYARGLRNCYAACKEWRLQVFSFLRNFSQRIANVEHVRNGCG